MMMMVAVAVMVVMMVDLYQCLHDYNVVALTGHCQIILSETSQKCFIHLMFSTGYYVIAVMGEHLIYFLAVVATVYMYLICIRLMQVLIYKPSIIMILLQSSFTVIPITLQCLMYA